MRAENAADLVCAATRGRLVSTPLNRGTVLTALLLSASSKRWWGRKKWLRWRGREWQELGPGGGREKGLKGGGKGEERGKGKNSEEEGGGKDSRVEGRGE